MHRPSGVSLNGQPLTGLVLPTGNGISTLMRTGMMSRDEHGRGSRCDWQLTIGVGCHHCTIQVDASVESCRNPHNRPRQAHPSANCITNISRAISQHKHVLSWVIIHIYRFRPSCSPTLDRNARVKRVLPDKSADAIQLAPVFEDYSRPAKVHSKRARAITIRITDVILPSPLSDLDT